MSAARPSTEELRAAVRAALLEVLPAGFAQGVSAGAAVEHVTLRNDADLDALVRRVATLCEDPERRAALREGRHGFRLAGTVPDGRDRVAASQAGRRSTGAGDAVRIERGAVTERAVVRAAAEGGRLVVGPKAVLTPLARDKARVLGVEIERQH